MATTYTQEDIVRVYRSALEEGKRQGMKELIDTATTLASGFVKLKGLIEETYDSNPAPILADEPYTFELTWIDEIIKRGKSLNKE